MSNKYRFSATRRDRHRVIEINTETGSRNVLAVFYTCREDAIIFAAMVRNATEKQGRPIEIVTRHETANETVEQPAA